MKKRNKAAVAVISVFAALLWIFAVLTVISLIGCDAIFAEIDKLNPIGTENVIFAKVDSGSNAYIQKTDGSDVKILQISDIHIVCSIFTVGTDKSAVQSVYKLVNANKPDFIVLTGDLVYPLILLGSINNRLAVNAIGRMFEALEIPWCVVYGNHDAENISLMHKDEQSAYYESLPHCLFTAGDETVDGQGNYVVEVKNNDGSLNTALFMFDSHSYNGGLWKYDFVKDSQVEWYKRQTDKINADAGRQVKSVAYMHIPLYEYREAYKLTLDASSNVTPLYGTYAKSPASEKGGEGKLFEAITEKGCTKAVFCGHDHTNNASVRYNGVVLGYGMSIDYIAFPFIKYKTAQRGGSLVKITRDGSIYSSLTPQDNGFNPQKFVFIA
ncbi:MAG: metallophosphoesterase [Corallococcus sp.]|nr:metallophosphoesterase [Corallococcus sp.]